MAGSDKREAAYAQARTELLRAVEEHGIARLEDPRRGNEITRIVRELAEKYPELDGQLTRRLLAEGLGTDGEAGLEQDPGALPHSGHANVTSLQREDRRGGGDRRST